jgi:NitT/TauT family transport system ATP-binding protein
MNSNILQLGAGHAHGADSEEHSLSVERLSMAFPHDGRLLVALEGVSLEVEQGELVCIVGASGSGKSTLLNILAGLDEPTSGRGHVHGRVALMFQEAALLPWLTAAGNVELALELRGVKRSERRDMARELLNRVHLKGFEKRLPLERIWTETGLTILFVTHNAREAVRLGDRVLVFTSRPGRVGHEVKVDLPRPRSLDSPELAVIAGRITDRLKHEMGLDMGIVDGD